MHNDFSQDWSWTDFNSANDKGAFDIIPAGTLAKVNMTIIPGGYNDPSKGWTDDMATMSNTTGSIYLSCEYIVIEGKYCKNRIWGIIGLHSNKGPEWGNMGRTFIKKILNSARGFSSKDNSPQAQKARCINSFADLNGIEFIAKIDIEQDINGEDKNTIKTAITPDHKRYNELMHGFSTMQSQDAYYPPSQYPPQSPQQPQQGIHYPPSQYPPQPPQQPPQPPQPPQQPPQPPQQESSSMPELIPEWAK